MVFLPDIMVLLSDILIFRADIMVLLTDFMLFLSVFMLFLSDIMIFLADIMNILFTDHITTVSGVALVAYCPDYSYACPIRFLGEQEERLWIWLWRLSLPF